ncbi:MAG: hypothetical protein IT369_20535 [Candidatus Latescibacteria bacterium]|nr:hypothetical protein [Candidatus Latescibacterota bacterium]
MAIEFSANTPLTLKFPYGDFKELKGDHWVSFLYTIELDGERDRLLATPKLHQQLQEAQVKRGSVFTITKIESEGNRKDWRIEAEELPPPAPTAEKRNGAHPNGKPATTAPAMSHKPATESPDFEQLRQAMQHCLNAGYEAWEKLEVDLPFTTEDVRRVGITLFLECVRQEILPQTSGEGLPF